MNKSVSIIVGSVLGATEYVADAIQEHLESQGVNVSVHLSPEFEATPKQDFWLICTSTHGAGDLPDNIQPFATALESADLKGTEASVIGLGDSSYDTFCQGAATMEMLLLKSGCTITFPTHTIDVLQHPIPEDEAVEWIKKHFNNE